MAKKQFKLFQYPIHRKVERKDLPECWECIFKCDKNPGCKIIVWRNTKMRPSSRKKYPNFQTHPCRERGKSYIFIFKNPKI